KYFVAWGELQEHGIDRFPHSQSFTVVPLDAQSCLDINRLRGQFRIPGARYWFLPLYSQLAPRILDYENRRIAAAVTAELQSPSPDPSPGGKGLLALRRRSRAKGEDALRRHSRGRGKRGDKPWRSSKLLPTNSWARVLASQVRAISWRWKPSLRSMPRLWK